MKLNKMHALQHSADNVLESYCTMCSLQGVHSSLSSILADLAADFGSPRRAFMHSKLCFCMLQGLIQLH